ncbi:type I pantothenate kinase [Paenibacillus cookii]|uniref:Pantothenate kinase n=1 Tax=Paenibacillus cookii TaxID=157839 RepID=A0ABQ4LVZ7_9BACL|nr:type I pantothenate kinase [Paenibacillus cookii]KHF35549.1 Pantothenate kinase [Paenibacillus sp. P1XP2]GIO67447.1 pantothenate kinase [Paenibacillus cookii]
MKNTYSPYFEFDRNAWALSRDLPSLTISEEEFEELKGLNEKISIEEVSAVYLPLARLIHLYVTAFAQLQSKMSSFLSVPAPKAPFVIGIAGSVSVGKSTTARLLQTLLSRWPEHPKVDLVTTDGFLYPNRVLEAKGIMNKKGFPESYDINQLMHFISSVKSGEPALHAPLYSHFEYDVLKDRTQLVDRPDILIVEGINVLQVNTSEPFFVSDFFDFSIYIDADEENIRKWYIERFLLLRDSAFQDPRSYFHKYATLSEEEAVGTAAKIWQDINAKNLHENILPTKERAKLIIKKGSDHLIEKVMLRK